MFSLLFINAMLQLYSYTGKVSISMKDEIAERRGVLEHWSDKKIIFYTKLKITSKTGPPKFLHIDTFGRKQLLTTILPENKTTVSMTLLANWQIPNCPQLRLSPRKYQKKERANMCGFFKLFLSHKWRRPQEWTKFNNSKNKLKVVPAFTLLEATCSSTMTSKMFILGLKNVFLGLLEGMAQSEHLVWCT